MSISKNLEIQGEFLFKYRSFLPFLIIPIIMVGLRKHGAFDRILGERIEDIFEAFFLIITFTGLFIRAYVVGTTPKGTSGRNTKRQKAEHLNTTGLYSIVRHPLYLGNYLICLGLLLLTENLLIVIIITLLYIIYYERIIFAEEAFLREKFGEQFTKWSQITPMIIPKFSLWKAPERKFSIKEVLRREYTALLGIAVAFVSIKVVGHYFEDDKIKMRKEWLIFLLVSLIAYVILRSLKKYTNILNTNN